MQRIRIGNDVRLNLTLHGPRAYDQANIKQLRCYLVNTTMFDSCVGDCFSCGDCYGVERCGCPCYHAMPHCNRHHCSYHTHNHWHRNHMCMLDPHGCNPAAGEALYKPKYGAPFDAISCGACQDFTYLTYSRVCSKANSIQCYFPAKDQMYCGAYKLIVQVVIYEPGWGKTDLHTYTMDYGEVFILVDDNTGASGDITLDVDHDDILNKNVTGITIKTANLYIHDTDTIKLGELDRKSHYYTIMVALENGSVLEYTPNNWPYEKLNFTASTDGVIEVDPETGVIKATAQDYTTSAHVTVSAENNGITAEFTVTVMGGNYDYIGYLPVRPYAADQESDEEYGFSRTDQSFEKPEQEYYTAAGVEAVNVSELTRVNDLSKPVQVQNDTDGKYLWFVTRQPIACAVNISIASANPIIYIPLTKYQFKKDDSKYYYCCPNPIKANAEEGGDIFCVKFESV